MDRNKGVKYAAAAYSAQVLRGGGLETLARERDSSPLEIERNRDPRVREGYLSILEGPLQDWSELFSRGGQGGREGRIYESGKETTTTTAARRVEQVACWRWRTVVVGWWSNEERQRERESSYYLWKSRANLTSGATGVFPVNIYEPSVPPLSRHGSSPLFQHHAQFSILETRKFPRRDNNPPFDFS